MVYKQINIIIMNENEIKLLNKIFLPIFLGMDLEEFEDETINALNEILDHFRNLGLVLEDKFLNNEECETKFKLHYTNLGLTLEDAVMDKEYSFPEPNPILAKYLAEYK